MTTNTVGYPQIIAHELPIYEILALLGMPVLFGVLIETGAGIVQAVNERIDGALLDRGSATASRRVHLTAALAGLTVCVALSQFGIITLVTTGYGLMAWGFLIIYIIPLFTNGVIIMRKRNGP